MRDHFLFASFHWLFLLVGQDTCTVVVGYGEIVKTPMHDVPLLKYLVGKCKEKSGDILYPCM